MRPIRDLRWASVFTSLAARALESRVTFVGAAVALTVFTSGVPLSAQAQDVDTARASIVKIVSKEDGIRRTGTGFVVQVEPDAVYIATASHVVKNDSAPQIEFLARRNRPVTAAIVRTEGDDLQSGIALLIVRGKENMPERLRPLPFATTDELKGGQEVIAIGFGLGQGDWAVIRANVASLDGRDIRLDGRIEEGNSGGPILKGYQVVGLITGTQGYGHATPAMFVERILRGWGLEVTRADTPAVRPPLGAPDRRTGTPGSDQRYALRSAGATQGRRTLSSMHTEMRDATLIVDGVQREGSASLVSDVNYETQILRVSNGAVTRIRVTFLAHSFTLTRGTGRAAIVNPLQGKTVIGESSGGQWSFSSPDGALSPAEREELVSMFQPDDDGLFPPDPVPVGHEWNVSGADLRAALGPDSGEGSVTMRLRRIVSCGSEQSRKSRSGCALPVKPHKGSCCARLRKAILSSPISQGRRSLTLAWFPGLATCRSPVVSRGPPRSRSDKS